MLGAASNRQIKHCHLVNHFMALLQVSRERGSILFGGLAMFSCRTLLRRLVSARRALQSDRTECLSDMKAAKDGGGGRRRWGGSRQPPPPRNAAHFAGLCQARSSPQSCCTSSPRQHNNRLYCTVLHLFVFCERTTGPGAAVTGEEGRR